MSEAIKPTPGEWVFRDDDGWRLYIDGVSVMGDAAYYPWVPENKADWVLFADAGNTYNTTGLTPRQLVERVKELEDTLDHMAKSMTRQLDLIAERAPGAFLDKQPVINTLRMHSQRAQKALSKSLPNTVAEGP